MRSDGKRVTREASRATGTCLFFPKGALTHHPGGAVVFPLEIVLSSPRQEPPTAVALRNAPAGAGLRRLFQIIFEENTTILHS